MKRLIMALAVVLFDAVCASAATEVVDGVTWTYSVSKGKASVYKGSSSPAIPAATKGALTIPALLGGCPVTSIGSCAFYNCDGLTSVTIPEGVTGIDSHAFNYCDGLTSVTIPEGVTSIGDSAFYGCSGLTSVTIPSSVMSIGLNAFRDCRGLTRVDVTKLEKWYGISFENAYANPLYYAHCLYLNGEEVTDLVIPSSVTSIGDSAFYGCSGLTSVTIPEGVSSIGVCAFCNCSGLTSITIPEGVTSIGNSAFYGCSGLTSITIPEGVTSIGSSAFENCRGLMRVNITNLEKWYEISFQNAYANPLYYAHHLYLNGEEVGNLIIPSGVTSIGNYAFLDCVGLMSVTIPSGVTSIGNSAFSGCSGLTSITIPEGVTSIGNSAFYGCSGLTSITIPEGVTSIGNSAFYGCSGLTSVTIPKGVELIQEKTFYNCSSLLKIDIPMSVLSIAGDAFGNCHSVRRLTIPASVASVQKTSGGGSYTSYFWPQEIDFLGPPPNGIGSEWLGCGRIGYCRECGLAWQKLVRIDKFAGFERGERFDVVIVSAAIRENDPTVMDVVYKVKSTKPTVKVRALAFQDGERSFAKVVRPTEFIEDTAKNIGDAITANEEHKLSWRISSDWMIDLATVKFEVLASAGDLLPLELTTIPKIGDHAAMEISWNAMTEQQVLDALLWLFADGDEGLTLSNGILLKNGTSLLVVEANLSTANAIGYVYGKMGFSVLSGNELKYANEMTRLGLSPSGVRQYAWRPVEE